MQSFLQRGKGVKIGADTLQINLFARRGPRKPINPLNRFYSRERISTFTVKTIQIKSRKINMNYTNS